MNVLKHRLFLSASLFIAYSLKALIIHPQFADAAVLFILAGIYGYSVHLNNQKTVDLNADTLAEVTRLRDQVSSLALKTAKTPQFPNLGTKF